MDQFTDKIERLSRYVATLVWKQSSALAKVMTNLKDLVLVAPARPTRTYLCGSVPDAINTTYRITLGVVNIPMVDDIDYQSTLDEYISNNGGTTPSSRTGTRTTQRDTTSCCSTA